MRNKFLFVFIAVLLLSAAAFAEDPDQGQKQGSTIWLNTMEDDTRHFQVISGMMTAAHKKLMADLKEETIGSAKLSEDIAFFLHCLKLTRFAAERLQGR